MDTYISNIQHLNIHDGEGIRTIVFFQGCLLACKWCQNPELQSLQLIPNINDSEEKFEEIIRFIDKLKKIHLIHILPFHQLGSLKYKLIGKNYTMKLLEEENEVQIYKCVNIAEKHGYRVDIGGAGK